MRRLIFFVLILLIGSESRPSFGSEKDSLSALEDLLASSRYEDVLVQGDALLDSLSLQSGTDPRQEAYVLDLMVQAGYRTERVMEPRFLEMAQRSLEINETHSGPDDLATATSLMHLANLLNQRRDLAASIPYYDRAIGILTKLGAEQDQRRATLLSSEGVALRRLGEYDRARQKYEEAARIQEAVLGPEHPDLATTLNNLANVCAQRGDYRLARDFSRRALNIREKSFGPKHEWVAESLHNLANKESYLGNYKEALHLQERSVKIFREALGEEHPRYWWSRQNLSITYLEIGDHAGALPILEEVLTALGRIYGEDHLNTTYTLDALGECHFQAERYDQALDLYSRSLQLIDDSLGPDNPEGATTMFQVGRCRVALGNLSEGIQTLSHSLTIQESAVGAKSPELCSFLHDLARAHMLWNRPAEALEFARRSSQILESETGTEHPLYAEAVLHQARALGALGENDLAIAHALRAENIGRRHLLATVGVLSESRALDYSAKRAQGLDIALTLLRSGAYSGHATRAWDAVIRSRALILDEFTRRNAALSSQTNPMATALLDSSLSLRERLASLTLQGPGEQDPATFRIALESSYRELDRLDRQLSLVDHRLDRVRKEHEIGQDTVRSHLPPGTSIVSYLFYDQPPSSADPRNASRRLMAFVATSSASDVVAVDLGAADEIQRRVSDWRTEILAEGTQLASMQSGPHRGIIRSRINHPNSMQAYLDAAESLRIAIWDPLLSFLGNSDRVFIVPDGVLHSVNFNALPSASGGFLVESDPLLHVLMTERSVVSLLDDKSAVAGVLAVGDPEFGPIPVRVRETETARDSARLTGGTGRRDLHFDPLPYSREEVKDLEEIWNRAQQQDGGHIHVLMGEEATETAFKNNLSGHEILHLATHGFVLEEGAEEIPEILSRESALNRSGLALAWANAGSSGKEGPGDGILSASEISAMDMSGVSWAVLSACDTGLGDTSARGEGVFGLCRAFALAGAHTVIVSLWPVSDQDAREWMRALYTARLIDRLDTDRAIRSAHRTILAERRAQGLSVHPYSWAGFSAVGDWQ